MCDKKPMSKGQAAGVKESKASKGRRMRVYFCPECRAYHLTKNCFDEVPPMDLKRSILRGKAHD